MACARLEGSDFLSVIDTNVGFNKANLLVREALDYQVRGGCWPAGSHTHHHLHAHGRAWCRSASATATRATAQPTRPLLPAATGITCASMRRAAANCSHQTA